MTIERYVLCDKNGNETDAEWDDYQEAAAEAENRGWAVIKRRYEYTDSELVWTPDDSDTWPPAKEASNG